MIFSGGFVQNVLSSPEIGKQQLPKPQDRPGNDPIGFYEIVILETLLKLVKLMFSSYFSQEIRPLATLLTDEFISNDIGLLEVPNDLFLLFERIIHIYNVI